MKTKRAPQIRLQFDEPDEISIDGFAGGGGASTGIEMALGYSPDIAINHDAEALAVHAANHPQTRHIRTNIRKVHYGRLCKGKRVGFAWFSPDCTFHSKARGGKPFRDRNCARRIRGLAWEMVRCALEVKRATGDYPRVMFMENVEEIQHWCPLTKGGTPDWSKRGKSFESWVARFRNMGAAVEGRELRASWYGAPTSRKRLFVIVRFDGEAIVWPEATHGVDRRPFRTAAECIDFSIPVPSIFLNKRQAKAWGQLHRVPAPHRPLATPTLRRIARGVMRFVVDSPEPFIVSVRHHDDSHTHSTREPVRTITASDREFALIAPTLINTRNGERIGQAPRVRDIQQPFPTVTAQGSQGALVAAFLAKHHGGWNNRCGYRPDEPMHTIVAAGVTQALTVAFLAKHNGGHEATGQQLLRPIDTIVTSDQTALVTSHLVKFKGTCRDGQPVSAPMPTIQAHGNHIAEVRAFLVKFYGTKKDGRPLDAPLDTLTTKERFGLVTVTIAGEEYVIVDIGMRMLTPRELFRAQGFPEHYQIDCHVGRERKRLTKRAQTRLVGNSVPPHVAAAIVRANVTWRDRRAVA